jgi:hypothetical protein
VELASPASTEGAAAEASVHGRRALRAAPSWLREPLLHFIALGAVLFGVDHVISQRAGDAHTIVVGPEVDSEAVEVFRDSRGRAPSQKELEALHRVWIDNEVLYREGLAMQVDRGDDAIRQRVIFKALSVVDANVRLPAVDEAMLMAWFEQHRDKYDEPARYDFEEAVPVGDASEAAVHDLVHLLNSGRSGEANASLRVFKGRPQANLVQGYGPGLPQSLDRAVVGQWQAVPTTSGLRAVRLDALVPARPADFATLQGVVLQDWKDAVAAEQRTAAVRALGAKYRVRFENRQTSSSPE